MKTIEKKKIVLGKCPNCGLPMYDGTHGSIPMKKPVSGEEVKESLMVCKSCLSLPEGLSPDRIREHLLVLKLWEKEDVDLAVLAAEEYNSSKK